MQSERTGTWSPAPRSYSPARFCDWEPAKADTPLVVAQREQDAIAEKTERGPGRGPANSTRATRVCESFGVAGCENIAKIVVGLVVPEKGYPPFPPVPPSNFYWMRSAHHFKKPRMWKTCG